MPDSGAMRNKNQPAFHKRTQETPHNGAKMSVRLSDIAADTQSMEASSGVTQTNVKKMRVSGLTLRKKLGTAHLHSVISQGLDK